MVMRTVSFTDARQIIDVGIYGGTYTISTLTEPRMPKGAKSQDTLLVETENGKDLETIIRKIREIRLPDDDLKDLKENHSALPDLADSPRQRAYLIMINILHENGTYDIHVRTSHEEHPKHGLTIPTTSTCHDIAIAQTVGFTQKQAMAKLHTIIRKIQKVPISDDEADYDDYASRASAAALSAYYA